MMRIETHFQVLAYTALITALAVGAPLLVVGVLLAFIPGLPLSSWLMPLGIAGAIPLLIAPPIAYVGLSMLRILTLTVDKVDANIRFDPMTGVLNRNHMLDKVRARMGGGVLMMVDADHFKRINDSFGHAVGDEALILLARTLDQVAGPAAMVGRLGGEEFAIFLPGQTLAQGAARAQNICDAVRTLSPLLSGCQVPMTVSIGVALHDSRSILGESLRIADQRLYAAKHAGRDCVVCADSPDAGRALQFG
jgi:diguanylate cyclase (GGDEF)-like protein